ncbi:MAG: zinc dependent phospholipase C family protein [Eubacterium sp.]|nr:zinc dependent phospholipase C family protein [Eubacterium sp.]
MPDITVHNAMGDSVLNRLPEEIADEIRGESNAFHVGVLGPDPFFFYRFFLPPFRNGVDQRGTIMHHEKCREFLMEMTRRFCSPEEKNHRQFAYLAGFLCHYALDSTVHPYINMLAARRVGMHTAVERKLDRIALKRSGRNRNDIMKLVVPFPEIPELRSSMKAVYGWDDDLFRDGYRHMKGFLWFVKDDKGILDKVTGSLPIKPVILAADTLKKIAERHVDPDYKKKIIAGIPVKIPTHGLPGLFAKITGKNYARLAAFPYSNHFCDDMEMKDFDRFEELSEEYAVKLITAAYDYRAGRAGEDDLAELIGDRDYSGTVIG